MECMIQYKHNIGLQKNHKSCQWRICSNTDLFLCGNVQHQFICSLGKLLSRKAFAVVIILTQRPTHEAAPQPIAPQ